MKTKITKEIIYDYDEFKKLKNEDIEQFNFLCQAFIPFSDMKYSSNRFYVKSVLNPSEFLNRFGNKYTELEIKNWNKLCDIFDCDPIVTNCIIISIKV